jgi:hypothetical protein
MTQAIIGALFTGLLVLAYLFWNSNKANRTMRQRLAGVENIDAEIALTLGKLESAQKERQKVEAENGNKRAELEKNFNDALAKYEAMKRDLAVVEENVNDISFGLYKPHFSFQSSEDYKTSLEKLRDRERDLIRNGGAAVAATNWTINNDARAGQKMAKQYTKLLLRAFNGECDAAVANVTWNNITKMEERVKKAFEAINELGGVMQMSITHSYLQLKLDELRLTFELEEKKQHEREEQRRVREQIREEEKAQREIEKAKEDAEKSEAEYQKLLAKAREEALRATGTQLQALTDKISTFEQKLDEARQKKERAIARAQLTKSGFVYVISNIGSFGERVFKIGMTRRLEPMDRIAELGDASVPFPYDLHAMLYSDNAPELEAALHKHFSGRELNLVNARKEFFAGIEMDEIEIFVKQRGLSAQFIKVPEAKEYRETLAKRAELSRAASAGAD